MPDRLDDDLGTRAADAGLGELPHKRMVGHSALLTQSTSRKVRSVSMRRSRSGRLAELSHLTRAP
ncbi:hypothetical protein BJ970_007519 [Saccharopolyspora phatthalungensis]|uniref:Uncharacterized protein n=1 Tax=Saccharopolyspora phatthalungensis TaxID=664693 RepID=A0A840QKC9_9PSEU|nr:hypothetical protein [Saccharopolyspora phatthalungensis]